MNAGPSVIVNKGGFFSSLFRGFFGLLMVLVICVTALAISGLWTARDSVHRLLDGATQGVPDILRAATSLQEALPPVLRDALNDHRAYDYRDSLTLERRMQPNSGLLVISVENHGDEVVSLLGLRILAISDGRNYCDRVLQVATPLAVGDEWRGPLLPGQTRRLVVDLGGHFASEVPDVDLEINELRVWDGPWQPPVPATAAIPAVPQVLPSDVPPPPAEPAPIAKPALPTPGPAAQR